MLHGLVRMLQNGVRVCRHTAGVQNQHLFSVTNRFLSSKSKDYSLPNSSWNDNTKQLYDKFSELSKDGSWERLPSYNTSVHYREGNVSKPEGLTRLFTRILDQEGVAFEYCMFYNKAEKRIICIFQPGPYLQGPKGYTHGGCIATMIDTTVGTGAVYSNGPVMTANLNVDYRNPIPLGSTVIIESRVDKVEGRKIYTSCQVRNHDESVLHTEATALFIKLSLGESEAKL